MGERYSEAFEWAVDFVLCHEGGYVNDPDDPGGETKFGVSKRSFPHLDIKNLTKDQAKQIYHQHYWVRLSCEHVPAPLALALFDTAVNCGVYNATRFAQIACNILYPSEPLRVDGILGKHTLKRIKFLSNAKKQDMALAGLLLLRRIKHYVRIKGSRLYLLGWSRRVAHLLDAIEERQKEKAND